jgi:hypothetical protein
MTEKQKKNTGLYEPPVEPAPPPEPKKVAQLKGAKRVYVALQPLTVAKTGETVVTGERVNLGHLTEAQVLTLLDKGVIAAPREG